VRISNRDRTLAPARRMFPRERRAFKLTKSEKNNLMAATLIPDYDGRKARMVPGDYQETQSRVQFNVMSVCLSIPGCDPMGSQFFSHKLLSKESLAVLFASTPSAETSDEPERLNIPQWVQEVIGQPLNRLSEGKPVSPTLPWNTAPTSLLIQGTHGGSLATFTQSA